MYRTPDHYQTPPGREESPYDLQTNTGDFKVDNGKWISTGQDRAEHHASRDTDGEGKEFYPGSERIRSHEKAIDKQSPGQDWLAGKIPSTEEQLPPQEEREAEP
ncbi:hypothetical protein AnigIFM63309_001312 [Aspergillus niger]|nr:hypothetical protein AnigIFM63309_001312 [Aspergillus niger]